MWQKKQGNFTVCLLCPHNCRLSEGSAGLCRARKAHNGNIIPLFYGQITALHIDPMEKKPLYHFHPGEKILSLGGVGCNMRCGFCQNHSLSRNSDFQPEEITTDQIITCMQKENIRNIAFTYNEPVINIEFILDVFSSARRLNYHTVLVTNGYIETGPLQELLSCTNALNIDLKFFNNYDYRQYTGAGLNPVRRSIEISRAAAHVEITSLIIPGINDHDENFITQLEFLKELSPRIPLHLSRYFPAADFNLPPTPPETLEKLRNLAKKYLDFVFIGNLANNTSTVCPVCGKILIKRNQYQTEILHKKKECTCGFDTGIVF